MKKILAIACAALVGTTSASFATTLDFTRGATESVGAQVIAESQNVAVGSDEVIVDFLVGDLTIGQQFRGLNWQEGGSFLGAGTYDSTLIHYDPLDSVDAFRKTGQVSFDTSIVAIILSNASRTESTRRLLNLSDATFGITGATYLRSTGRRAEGKDLFTLVDDRTLAYDFHTLAQYIDNVRVITAARTTRSFTSGSSSSSGGMAVTPVPASLPLLLAGVGGLVYMRRRSKAASKA